MQTIFVKVRQSNIDHSVFVCKTLECFILSEDDFKQFNLMWTVELHEHKYVHTYFANYGRLGEDLRLNQWSERFVLLRIFGNIRVSHNNIPIGMRNL